MKFGQRFVKPKKAELLEAQIISKLKPSFFL